MISANRRDREYRISLAREYYYVVDSKREYVCIVLNLLRADVPMPPRGHGGRSAGRTMQEIARCTMLHARESQPVGTLLVP